MEVRGNNITWYFIWLRDSTGYYQSEPWPAILQRYFYGSVFPRFFFSFFFYLNLLKSLNEVYTAVQKWYTLSTFYFPFSWSNAFVIFEILTAPWKYKFSNESFLDNIRDDLLKIKLVHRVLYDRIVTKIGSGRLVN